MNINFRPSLLILIVCLSSFASAENLQSKTSLSSFFTFVKEGKHQEASNLIFSAPGREAATIARVKMLSSRASETEGSSIEVVIGKEQGTVARIIIKDTAKNQAGKVDYDGVLMIKRANLWKIVLNARDVEENSDVVTPEERKALRELQRWQDATMESLNSSRN